MSQIKELAKRHLPPKARIAAKALHFRMLQQTARAKRAFSHNVTPNARLLHLGCGSRKIAGWLNCDVAGSDYDVDFTRVPLPWKSESFDAIVSQHVIEHLHITAELIPLLRELRRTLQAGGEIWLSCPDIEKVCRSYVEHGMVDMIADRQSREPDFSLNGLPPSHMANVLFHQDDEHKNLFDFALLDWTLRQAGFETVRRVDENALLERFPSFPARRDDHQSLYVVATRTPPN